MSLVTAALSDSVEVAESSQSSQSSSKISRLHCISQFASRIVRLMIETMSPASVAPAMASIMGVLDIASVFEDIHGTHNLESLDLFDDEYRRKNVDELGRLHCVHNDLFCGNVGVAFIYHHILANDGDVSVGHACA